MAQAHTEDLGGNMHFLWKALVIGLLAIPFQLGAGAIDSKCAFKEKNLFGRSMIVDSFPGITLRVIDSFPDLKVTLVADFTGLP